MSTNSCLIKDTSLVNGDGSTFKDNVDILIRDGYIEAIRQVISKKGIDGKVIDARRFIALPCLINIHAHGVVENAPMFSSGAPSLSSKRIKQNIDKFIAEGTTHILSLDGFSSPKDIMNATKTSNINMKSGITSYDTAYKAAKIVDGKGISEEFNIKDVLDKVGQYIVCIGEVGSGATLGGGVQDYYYIPKRIKQQTGIKISEHQAHILKQAALGTDLRGEGTDLKKFHQLVDELGLRQFGKRKVKRLISDSVMPPIKMAKRAIEDAAKLSSRHNLPMIVHTSSVSQDVIYSLPKLNQQLILAHCNHSSLNTKRGIDFIKKMKKKDAVIDVATFNILSNANYSNNKQLNFLYRLIAENLVDIISTDFGGGSHTPILTIIKKVIEEGITTLADVVKMCTLNPAIVLPKLASSSGIIKQGNPAHVILVEQNNLDKVRYVFYNGEVLLAS